jgi:hypothetical protein
MVDDLKGFKDFGLALGMLSAIANTAKKKNSGFKDEVSFRARPHHNVHCILGVDQFSKFYPNLPKYTQRQLA